MARRKTLTSIKVGTVEKPGYYSDPITVGLYLQVTKSQRGVGRSWLYRFTSPVTRKLRWLGLGSAEKVSLAEARKKAEDYRRIVRQERRDPIEERRGAMHDLLAAKARELTFAQCCEAYLAQHLDSFRNDKHRQQWRTSLGQASAAFGLMPVAQVDEAVIVRFLEPIWRKTPESGSRTRGRIEKVLSWATVGKLRKGPNPARWKDQLEFMLKRKPKGGHHAAMPWQEVPSFMELLRTKDSLSARALEFTVLCAARTGETIGAHWNEIDFAAKVWTVPAGRIKGGVEHVVPLPDRAVEILRGMNKTGELIFPLSDMAMLQLLRGTAGNGYTVHGFRSAFRDWCGDQSHHARDVIEHALAHKLKDKTEAAYRRGTAVEKRRKLMQSWANFCAKPVSTATVTPLHKAS